ncbi:MAG: ferredoxin-type protein NapG [Chlorobi bacterium]|nr:ferredoxin-type protein NapG [Chlorobiota bacterium]
MKENKMATRRDVIIKLMQGAGFLGLGGLTWGAYIDEAKAADIILRPPGAIPEDDFIKACTKCGACVTACPYDTLKLAEPGDEKPVGTPFFEPRKIACEMCPDIPCVPVCPSGALDVDLVSSIKKETNEKVLDINKAKMGATIIDEKSCIAYWGIQCDLCYRACPLMDEAIKLEYARNERTGKHAFLRPVVDNDVCTGCGLCEHACVTEVAAIKVLPTSIVLGKAGDHYIKGWDATDEKRLKGVKDDRIDAEDSNNKAMDYLNGDWEDLVDD